MPCVAAEPPEAATAAMQRARGVARLSIASVDGRSRIAAMHQAGSSRIRLPRATGSALEAVLLNTAGGLTGGDSFATEAAVGPGAAGLVTSQAAERIYRSAAGTARVESRLAVRGDGRLCWLPQETIVFNHARLARTLDAEVDPDGTLLALEAVVLGRTAMGERLTDIALADTWRIRRGGRLVFADTTRLDGDTVALMGGAATGGGAIAFATLVLVAPDAGRHVAPLRAALDGMPGEAGVSALDGATVLRMIAGSGQALRALVTTAVTVIRGVPMPRVWTL